MAWLVIELLPEGEGEMGACVYDGPSTVYIFAGPEVIM
jgi:hypothetical protein